MSDSLLEHALRYAAQGLSIIPTTGKVPAGAWKQYQSDPAEASILSRLFRRDGVTGLAVVLGGVSGGLVVRDYDAEAAYAKWADAYPDLSSSLPTVRTARGSHVYFICPACRTRKLDDGELRASGTYVLLPPSLHPDGHRYAWVNPLPDGLSDVPVIDAPPSAGLTPEVYIGVDIEGGTKGVRVDSPPRGVGYVSSAIHANLPSRPGMRHDALFNLVRGLKDLPEFNGAKVERLEPVFQEWHGLASPRIRTRDYGTNWAEFQQMWRTIRYGAGQSKLAAIVALADSAPLPSPAMRYGTLWQRRLVAACNQLQAKAGDQPFVLASRPVAKLLSVSHTAVANALLRFADDGILLRIEKGRRRHASKYRYIGDQQQTEKEGAAWIP